MRAAVGRQIFGRARSKSSIVLKGSSINNSPRPTTAKEKPAVLSRRV
jgi:hypothetical protein